MIETLARACYTNRRWVLAGWIVLVVALSALGTALAEDFRTQFSLPGSESQAAADLLREGGFGSRGEQSGQIVFTSSGGVRGPEVRAAMEDLFARIRDHVEGTQIGSPYDPRGSVQISPRGDVAFAEIEFGDITFDEAITRADDVEKVRDAARLPEGLRVELGGDMFAEQAEFSSEAFGFIAAALILLVAFGSLLAMGLPLVTAMFGIGCGFAIVQLATTVLDVPLFAPAAVAMISIGVGIDYALFIVTRYREELAAGLEPEEAVVRSLATAGRAVIFAGTTVVISLLSLLLFGQSVTKALALSSSAGVLMVMLASITLLPALLGFAGRSIDRLGLPHRRRPDQPPSALFWYRWSRFVQRRPWPVAIAGFAVLLVLGAPLASMRLGFGDAGNRPDTDTSRRAYDLVARSFGPGFNGPLIVAVRGANDGAALGRLSRGLGSDPGVAFASPPIPNGRGDVALVQVIPKTSPQDEATELLVHRLRDDVVPAAVTGSQVAAFVGGATAAVVDFADFQSSRLPVFIGAVLALSFLLLLAVFRSLLVPLKAVVMNLLSIGAAYGVVVATFQWGWGAGVLGIGERGPVEAWAPMMLFAIVFGLSMDYEVFLLSRIKEEYDRSGDNAGAVADGLAKTARLITAAAAIMFFVFGGFVLSVDRSLQLFGLGLAVAVLIDATIVRLVLVPATMELLGDRNWWLPSWFGRLLPRVSVEPRAAPIAPQPATDGGKPIGYWLKQADKAISREFERVFKDNGLTRQHWQVLNVVRSGDGATKPATVRRELDGFAGAARVDRLIDDLVDRGWISKGRDGLRLTDEGRTGRREVVRLVKRLRQRTMDGIDPSDYVTTIATLERIVENMKSPTP